jgi:hypothetical protein
VEIDVDAIVHRLGDPPRSEEIAPPTSGGAGPAGNARLTALTGSVLVLPVALVFGSGLVFGQLRPAHFFAGFLLIPLVALKLASTAWRVVRYYLADRQDGAYRRIGPPWWIPRALGPVVAASGIIALASGVVLWAGRSERGPWSTVHTASAVVFSVSVGLHLLLRVWRTIWETGAEIGRIEAPRLPGRISRHAVLAATLISGVILGAVLTAGTDWPLQPPGHQ